MNGNLYARLASRFPPDRTKAFARMLDGREVSYADLDTGAGRLAALLKARGIAPGDRVAVQTAKSVEAVMLYLATLKVGAVLLPLNTA
jgi:malonyl-CoA/methylmalonyl-CoA synthetase